MMMMTLMMMMMTLPFASLLYISVVMMVMLRRVKGWPESVLAMQCNGAPSSLCILCMFPMINIMVFLVGE